MLWTVFKLLILVWMLQMVLHFGVRAIPVVLVVSLTALLLRLVIRRTLFSPGGRHDSMKTGRFNSTTAEQFAGASKINPPFHYRS